VFSIILLVLSSFNFNLNIEGIVAPTNLVSIWTRTLKVFFPVDDEVYMSCISFTEELE
jgi:hypothetical protein